LGNKLLVTTLLYRGSINGWTRKDFHYYCDNKGTTICLLKIKDGDCIGGYTNVEWNCSHRHFGDSAAMLFNLTSRRHFPNKGTGKEIFCSDKHALCFHGGGNASELTADSEPFNNNRGCFSSVNQPGYRIPVDKSGKNSFTNWKDGYFPISELEVWGVTSMK
jgi:hypothetical protein